MIIVAPCLRALVTLCLTAGLVEAKTWIVAPSGGDFAKIQLALDAAQPGDLILVKDKPGGYLEKIRFPRSGNASAGSIVLRAHPGHSPILDGTNVTGANMVLIEDKSHVTLQGFEIRNNRNVNDGSGVRIIGAGSHIEILDNRIHDIRGKDAMGITVYGTSVVASISHLLIRGNTIYDCEPAQSECLTLNGNVEKFEVIGNLVRDVNNIGIDFIGGEKSINPTFVCRDGVCRGNTVLRANSNYGGGFGAGIYVDGAKDITIEHNLVSECDLGIEVGAENAGIETTGITVRDNILYRNDKCGIVFGGFDKTVGRVKYCEFTNNVCFSNHDPKVTAFGEIWIQWASDNKVHDNIFVAATSGFALHSGLGDERNSFDYNLWHTLGTPGQENYLWRNQSLTGFAQYRSTSKQDANSSFEAPKFVDASKADFSLAAGSPAIDSADPTRRAARLDISGSPRTQDGDLDGGMRLDRGAHEFTNIRLAVAGDLIANGKLSVSITGTAALPSALFIGSPIDPIVADPIGVLFFSLTGPWILLPWGPIPTTADIPLPAQLPPNMLLCFQSFCFNGRGFNLSNCVEKTNR